MAEPSRLYYWPMIPGRGEFVRMILEDVGADYEDVARLPEPAGGTRALIPFMYGHGEGWPVFAPPILEVDGELIAQTPAIAAFLGDRHGLVPDEPIHRAHAQQMMLTIADVVAEVHDTHHPISVQLTYEQQLEPARERAAAFTGNRLAKWLGYFEAVLGRERGTYLIGDAHSYPDLALCVLLDGIEYAFPRAFAREMEGRDYLAGLRVRIHERPRVAAYLSRPRHLAFNEKGIFRHYDELDLPDT